MTEQSGRGISTVEGNSMLPILRPGDQVLLDLNPVHVRCGDLITFKDGERLIVHRVVECGPPLVTRGDNAPRADDPILPGQMVGLVIETRRGSRRIAYRGFRRRTTNALLGRLSRLGLRHPRLQRVFRCLGRLVG